MPPTNFSFATDLPAVSSVSELPPTGGLCAIHQPNLLPRLSTLAKLFAADYWIVLDDVQFARRDYQHRARLADLGDPCRRQWLTISTRLPQGRQTPICEALMTDPARSRRCLAQLLLQYYRASPHWPAFGRALDPVLDLFATTNKTVEVAEASTRVLLNLLGWQGRVLRSSLFAPRTGRSQRLADLAALTGARAYLCGTGGMTYLETDVFTTRNITIIPFRAPTTGPLWAGQDVSAVHFLMCLGPQTLADQLRARSGSAALGCR
ncbi:WbqC family protein [Streptomyces iranensis]|uniref:WbqC family protein n=1 Tax=Streptomyces iranensis TaxID=576784 RepID=UPI0039B73F8B